MPVLFGEIDAPLPVLPGGRVHLYAAGLGRPAETVWGHLTEAERGRADKFRVPRIRDQFIQARGWLRVLLAHYLKCDPAAVPILVADGGKPLLPPETGLHFNLSHTDGLALYAVACTPVGIDVERVRNVPDAVGLAQRFFSAREQSLFRALPAEEVQACFLRAWTRKEAVLKATGRGVQSLDCCEVSFGATEPVSVVSLDGDPAAKDRWLLHAWEPEPGFVAAMAVERPTGN